MAETTVDGSRELEQAVADVAAAKKRLAELRRTLPSEPAPDYVCATVKGDVHNMGRRCSYCTMWADGFNGLLPHLEDRMAFVMSSPDSPAEQEAFARRRGWRFRMVSAAGTSFARDAGFEDANGDPVPGVS